MPVGPLIIPALIARVREDARRRGVRWTAQRQTIVETFFAGREHLTVEELHKRVRAIDHTVSAATVYRTVNMLVEIGVAHKRNFGHGSASFESALDREHHDHLVCVACGKISEFHHDGIEDLQDEVAKTHGFRLSHHRMELYGLCAECQAAGAEMPSGRLAEVRQH
jgi:Fur family ferric uptake transcriptional regulator